MTTIWVVPCDMPYFSPKLDLHFGGAMSPLTPKAGRRIGDAPTKFRSQPRRTKAEREALEFDQVLVLAPERYLGPADETADERRLLYVAMTRAKRAAALLTF